MIVSPGPACSAAWLTVAQGRSAVPGPLSFPLVATKCVAPRFPNRSSDALSFLANAGDVDELQNPKHASSNNPIIGKTPRVDRKENAILLRHRSASNRRFGSLGLEAKWGKRA